MSDDLSSPNSFQQLPSHTDTVGCAADQSMPPGARRPQQLRGKRRVDAILDCAAEMIASEGIGSIKLHRVAQNTCTTTGSMYHFFPDRDALLRALLERHTRELRGIVEKMEQEVASDWSELQTPDLVDRLTGPFIDFMDRHPDFLPLTRLVRISGGANDRDAELDQCVSRVHEALIALRMPDASATERKVMGLSITAIAQGFVSLMTRTDNETIVRLLRSELRRALIAYLDNALAQPNNNRS